MPHYLPCVEIEPSCHAKNSVIWLHGLGANGHDFEPIVAELSLPASSAVRFVFPHAPNRPITINNGYVMPGWFDIFSFERDDAADEKGIFESVAQINTLIERERERGVAPDKIILAGFSQGGAIAMHSALRYREPLGGLLVLSSYLPLYKTLKDLPSPINLTIPILMAHGTFDPVLQIALGRHSYQRLCDLGYSVDWREYAMEHSVCADEISDISQWLSALPALQTA